MEPSTRTSTCRRTHSQISAHTQTHSPIIILSFLLPQPARISKKNRLAKHDAALGSETQPTPAGNESGRDEERGSERDRVKEGEGEGEKKRLA